MIIINDKQIQIGKAEKAADKEYLAHCFSAKDFQLYITDTPLIEDYLLFKYNQENVGCFSINYTEQYGVRSCNPILYVEKRLLSTVCLIAMFKYIFESFNIDKISFVVFEHNLPCILVLKKLQVHCDGELKYYRQDSKRYLSCYIFSILPEEYMMLREKINSFFYGY